MTYSEVFEQLKNSSQESSPISAELLIANEQEVRAKSLISEIKLEKAKLEKTKAEKIGRTTKTQEELEEQRKKKIANLEARLVNLHKWLEIQIGWQAKKKEQVGTVTEKFLSEGGMPHVFVKWASGNLSSEVISVLNLAPAADSVAPEKARIVADFLNERSCTVGEITLMQQLGLERGEFREAIAFGLKQGLFKQLGTRYGNNSLLNNAWNPKDFGETPREKDEMGNPLIFFDTTVEPPQPEDYPTIEEFETAWDRWVASQDGEAEEELAHVDASEVWEQETNSSVPEPWDSPQQWQIKGVNCTYEGDIITWGDKRFRIHPKIKTIYLNPRVLVDFLEESWHVVLCFTEHFRKEPQINTEKAIIKKYGCKPSLFKRAMELAISLQLVTKNQGEYQLCSDNLICVVESALASPMPERNSDLNSLELRKQTSIAQTSSLNDSPESITTETLNPCPTPEDTDCRQEESTLSPHHPHANLSQFKASDSPQKMSETASPQSSSSSTNISLDSSSLKTSLDSSVAHIEAETGTAHILNTSSLTFTEAGTMRNGFVVEADTLTVPFLEKGYFWLESPAALSTSGKGPIPGQSKLEVQLKNLKILRKGECLNPALLEDCFNLPEGWTDPSESRSAMELLENDARALAIHSIPALPPSLCEESSTSIPCSKANESQQVKAITLHQPWASLVGIHKFFETREWATDYRGKIAIHSAKMQKDAGHQCKQLADLLSGVELVFGAVVAIADLTDCVLITEEFINQQSETERRCGFWKPGYYAWKLENIEILSEPIPAKGKQKLWNFELPSAKQSQDSIKQNHDTRQFMKGDRVAPAWPAGRGRRGTVESVKKNFAHIAWSDGTVGKVRFGQLLLVERACNQEPDEKSIISLAQPSPTSHEKELSSLELDELAKLIKTQQTEFETSQQAYRTAAINHLEKNIKLGHILNAAKTKVKESRSGRWLKWLEENCPRINERTARLAMRLARNEDKVREKSATVTDFGVRQAASLLNKDPNAKVTPMKPRSKCRWVQNPDGSRRYEANLCGIKRELHDTYQQAAVEAEKVAAATNRTPEQLIVEGLLKLVAENHGITEQGAIALAIEIATKENAAVAA